MSSRSFSNQSCARALRSMMERSIVRFRISRRHCERSEAIHRAAEEKEWIASSLTLLAMTATITLALRSVIGAALVAAVAMDGDAHDRARMLHAFEDEARQVLQRRRPQRLDPVQELVVEDFLDVREAPLQQAEIEQHAGFRIGSAAHGDLGTERMAVNLLAGFA